MRIVLVGVTSVTAPTWAFPRRRSRAVLRDSPATREGMAAVSTALMTRPARRSLVMRARELVLGPPPPRAVPARVGMAIRAEQATIEVVVTIVQLGAIAGFALLYSLTPKAFPANVPFEPVPVTLAVYAVFTGVRLWLALGRRLGPGFLAISTVVDIAILMITIWSFHLQYEAPPALSLKAPTLMYVFILIALRALTLEPWLVLLAGATAVAMWLGLVAYAVMDAGGMMGITRSFRDYAMSFDILIGAEVDKAVSIVMVTLILAVLLIRARNLLTRAVAEEQAAADLSRFFAPEVAQKIRSTERMLEPGRGEQREAAILFVDLRGFTALTGMLDASGVIGLLADYQDRVIAAVHRHGGSIDKFMGDGVLASFGATLPSETFAAQAAAAASRSSTAAAAWGEERLAQGLPAPRINAAVATGGVLFGTVGNAIRLEYTVIGEPVNVAAKLEKHCKAERALAVVTAATMRLAMAQGHAPAAGWRERPAAEVAGVDHPIDLAVWRGAE
jgi:adenylate cyclase